MYKFTDSKDWVTSHISNWRKLFSKFAGQPNVSMLEIGSFEGRSAIWFLENILTDPTAKLNCIEPYPTNNLVDNLASCPTGYKVTLVAQPSEQFLPVLLNFKQRFDIIYVDGSHKADAILIDGLLGLKLLKPAGIMLFDDYLWKEHRPHEPSPQKAIDAFIGISPVEVVYKGYQLAITKNPDNQ